MRPSRDARPSTGHAVRRRLARRRAVVGLVAAAALVVGLVAGAVGTTLLMRPDDPRVVAEAVLEPFPDWSASGSAHVEELSGIRQVVVDVSVPDGGLREVWLLDPETSGLLSLGLLSGSGGAFPLPAEIDFERYSVIDISQEPDDGDPAHSGDSIVRGELRGT